MQANESTMRRSTDRGNKVIVQTDEIDRITSLPANVLDEIFKGVSFRDLARTSILSKQWKNFWSEHPIVVLDKQFFVEITANLRTLEYGLISNIVDKILLHDHAGSIVKFVLDLSTIRFHDGDLDRWLLYVTGKGIKELILDNSDANKDLPAYPLPFCIFNCSALTYLFLTRCIVKPPYPTTLFPYLLYLYFKFIDFGPATTSHVLKTPLLSTLSFYVCKDIHLLNISAPKIKCLTILSREIHVNFLKNFPTVEVLYMVIHTQERFTAWSRFLSLYTKLRWICLNNYCIKVLSKGIIPKRLQSKAHHLEQAKLVVEFDDLDQVSGVVSFIRSCPNLRKLHVQVYRTMSGKGIEEVTRYLADPDCVDENFEKLEYMGLTVFEGTPSELIFLKLILAHSPSLIKMYVAPSNGLDEGTVRNFFNQLVISSRASPTVQVILEPHCPVV